MHGFKVCFCWTAVDELDNSEMIKIALELAKNAMQHYQISIFGSPRLKLTSDFSKKKKLHPKPKQRQVNFKFAWVRQLWKLAHFPEAEKNKWRANYS